MVPLSQIATVSEVKTPVQVTHVDGARTASVTASVVDNNIGAASNKVTAALEKIELPAGDEGVDAAVADQHDLDIARIEPGGTDQRFGHVGEQRFGLRIAQDADALRARGLRQHQRQR